MGSLKRFRACWVCLGTSCEIMGQNGLDLVRSQYLWGTQAQKALDLYGWLLGRQTKPDFVITD